MLCHRAPDAGKLVAFRHLTAYLRHHPDSSTQSGTLLIGLAARVASLCCALQHTVAIRSLLRLPGQCPGPHARSEAEHSNLTNRLYFEATWTYCASTLVLALLQRHMTRCKLELTHSRWVPERPMRSMQQDAERCLGVEVSKMLDETWTTRRVQFVLAQWYQQSSVLGTVAPLSGVEQHAWLARVVRYAFDRMKHIAFSRTSLASYRSGSHADRPADGSWTQLGAQLIYRAAAEAEAAVPGPPTKLQLKTHACADASDSANAEFVALCDIVALLRVHLGLPHQDLATTGCQVDVACLRASDNCACALLML